MNFDVETETALGVNILYKKYVHKQTTAEVHLFNDSNCENITFLLGFVTIPSDSKGIPHILEHSVLCGSKKYPLKDPFAVLLRSSVQTFLNAITFHNFTAYPAASYIKEDFYNLFDVYWDAVFNPLLLEEVFWIQGIHPRMNESIGFQGVVYNEMKGYYSEPFTIFWRALFKSLFPETHWSYDSGGDPREILHLSYEELVKFHKKFYSLPNLRVCVYGNIPDDFLSVLDQKISGTHSVGQKYFDDLQIKVSANDREEFYSKNSISDREWFAINKFVPMEFNFVTSDLFNMYYLGFQGAPLYTKLQDLKMADKVLRIGLLDIPFGNILSVGLQDIYEFQPKCKAQIENAVEDVLEKSLDKNIVENISKNFKASFIERFRNNPDRGIQILLKCCSILPFGLNPSIVLQQIFNFLDEGLLDTLQNLNSVREKVLDSRYTSKITLVPLSTFNQTFIEAEREAAKNIVSKLSIDQLELIEKRIKDYQQVLSEDSSVVPSLNRSVFSRGIKEYRLEQFGENIYFYAQKTHGLTYVSLLYPIDETVNLSLVSLLGGICYKSGTKNKDPLSLSLEILNNFASFTVYPFFSLGYLDDVVKAFLRFDFSCLDDKSYNAVEFLKNFISDLDFRTRRDLVITNIKELITDLTNSLKEQPARYARSLSKSFTSDTGFFEDEIAGVRYIKYLNKASLEELVDLLQSVWEKLILCQSPLVFISGNSYANFKSLEGSVKSAKLHKPPRETFSDLVHVPLDLNVAAASCAYFYEQPFDASGRVLEKLLSETYLWNEIRVKGGAYGSNLVFSDYGRVACFLSWDDPTPERSLEVFLGISDKYFTDWFNDSECEKLCVTTLGEYEAPVNPNVNLKRAINYHLSCISEEIRTKHKEFLFSLNAKEILNLIRNMTAPISTAKVVVGKLDLSKVGYVVKFEVT